MTADNSRADRQEIIHTASYRLASAAVSRESTEPVAGLLGANDIALAYEVQQKITAWRIERGASRIGRKIGLTSNAVQVQLGVNQPDFGVLFDDMMFDDGAHVPPELLLQPRAEAEVAFRLGSDLDDIVRVTDRTSLRAAIAAVYPAIEVVDSRITDWKISIVDTIADNASSGVFVLGAPSTLEDAEPANVTMTMLRNGSVVSEGSGRDCLDDPFNALEWLAAVSIDLGSPLKAGEIILSGALGPMVPARSGDVFQARIEPLGTVSVRF